MLLDVLLPRRCVVCGDAGSQLCERCRDGLPRLTPPLCDRCGAPTAWPVARCRECAGRRIAFVSARAAVPYDDDVRRFVRRWKERGLRSLAEEAADLVAERVPRPDVEVVTFVPGDAWRGRARGHQPAERLAQALARRWELPCDRLLDRAGTSRQQRGLTGAERRRNVRHAFSAVGHRTSAVLVDDVYTTGSTVQAAARQLHGRVEVVTFARTVRAGLHEGCV